MFDRFRIVAFAVLALILVSSFTAFAQDDTEQPGYLVHLHDGYLNVNVISDRIIRVTFSPNPELIFFPTIDVVPQKYIKIDPKPTPVGDIATINTKSLRVEVNTKTGAVRFLDLAGNQIAAEVVGGRSMEPAVVQGEKTYHMQQKWVENPDESLYGLGQMQLGTLDIKGLDIDLWQRNTNIVVPFLVSSRGYGIFWENLSLTRFGDLRQFVPIPAENLLDADGKPGGLTLRPMVGSQPAKQSADLMLDFLPQGNPNPAPRTRAGKVSFPRRPAATISSRATTTAASKSGSTATRS